MYSQGDYTEVMTYDDLDEIIEKPFNSILTRYRIGL